MPFLDYMKFDFVDWYAEFIFKIKCFQIFADYYFPCHMIMFNIEQKYQMCFKSASYIVWKVILEAQAIEFNLQMLKVINLIQINHHSTIFWILSLVCASIRWSDFKFHEIPSTVFSNLLHKIKAVQPAFKKILNLRRKVEIPHFGGALRVFLSRITNERFTFFI